MHRYIDQYGHYPTGLFASVCKGTQQGLPCPALAPSQSADRDDTSSSQINRKLSLQQLLLRDPYCRTENTLRTLSLDVVNLQRCIYTSKYYAMNGLGKSPA
ncbi:hypothetical protein KY285_011079 [Solanum tuberosum]|nr:hypothetical protein KY289_011639 [Solanum tuberosum]KAH0735372.1 hypothetical protein KY285_011079 [Solanum tuberosum]